VCVNYLVNSKEQIIGSILIWQKITVGLMVELVNLFGLLFSTDLHTHNADFYYLLNNK
jgi:hypothetical protein